MRTIYKYHLDKDYYVIPHFVEKILKIGYQNNVPTIWAIVDTDRAPEPHTAISVYGTGWELDSNIDCGKYIGTLFDGPFVWHYFYTHVKEDDLK